ncbi:MAG: hypothetical protein K6E38_00580 [Fretibacterium sp.]|nr:hypothetical protein [Fretibacterium sp.]
MSPLAYNVPFISIFLMMVTAILMPLLPNRNRIPECAACAAVAASGILSAFLLASVRSGLTFTFAMGHFPAPWGNELRAGPLEAVLALAFSAAMLLSILGNSDTTAEDIPRRRQPLYYALICLLMSSLLALTYTNDLFTAYVFIEINTLASCGIVAARDSPETVRAALRYLVMSLVGSGLLLTAICLLYDLTGHLLMENIRPAVQGLVASRRYMLPLASALCLMTASLAIKSALYPCAFWLPDAHGSATNASSAILSGLVLKGHILLIAKIFCRVYGMEVVQKLRMDNALLILGLLAMMMGSLHALGQKNVKRMIAWSSVAQVGYIFLGIGLNTFAGIAAACLHIIVHAAVKPMLFTAAGGLISASWHRKDLHSLMGSFYRSRWAGLGFIAGAFSMMGLPTFAGFASKLSLTLAAFDSPAIVWALGALAASSVLNALYYVPAVMVILTPPEESPALPAPPPTWRFRAAMAAFLALNFYLGLFCVPLSRLLERGVKVFG